jgi:glycosyltransferase involved in cell wall biosynthesis
VRGRNFLAVEFFSLGHQPQYLRHLAHAWKDVAPSSAILHIAVTDQFALHHHDCLEEIALAAGSSVHLHFFETALSKAIRNTPMPQQMPFSWLRPPGPPDNSHTLLQWQAAQSMAHAVDAEHLMFMRIDPVLPALAAGLKSSCRISGILFRAPITDQSESPARRAWSLHTRALVLRALRHEKLMKIFALDPRIDDEPSFASLSQRIEVLVDPADPSRSVAPGTGEVSPRKRFGVEEGRVVALHFGEISARKAIPRLSSAILRMPESVRRRLCLMIFGARVDEETPTFETDVERLRAGGVQVVYAQRYVNEEEAGALFAAADFVLCVYDGHIGMSGVVGRAAAAGVPVIADASGLVGIIVEKHGLGKTVEGDDQTALSRCIEQSMEDGFPSFELEKAQAYAKHHNPSGFSGPIIRTFLG